MTLRLLILVLMLTTTNSAWAKKKAKEGYKVSTRYVGKLKDGRIFDHNIGKKTLDFVIGNSNLIKPFDQAFIGMEEGQTKTINIPAKDAYGEFDENKLFRILASELPEGTKVGETKNYRIGGAYHPIRIVDIGEEYVYIDANPALAGKDLIFDITLVEILK